MRTRCRALLAASCLLVLFSVISGNVETRQAGATQTAVASQLLSDVREERYAALEAVRAIPAPQVGPELRAALFALLDRQSAVAQDAVQRGFAIDTVENPEFMIAVQRTVAALHDPAAIPSLARALGMFMLIQPLAEFGESAVPAVVDVVTSPRSRYYAVDDGLRVLQRIVQRESANPVSPSSRVLIRRAAQERLTGVQNFTTLWYAIDLAGALGDPELKPTLEALATDSAEVAARGITTQSLIEQTKRRASERLAGGTATRRPPEQ